MQRTRFSSFFFGYVQTFNKWWHMDWEKSVVSESLSILEAMKVINRHSTHGVVVVSPTYSLLGTVTDGDIRRAVLNGLSMEEPVSKIMNPKPSFLLQEASAQIALDLMKEKDINLLPVVDAEHKVVGIETLSSLLKPNDIDSWVVLMAGGEGQRLRPLTKECPKPLLKVGGKPLLETILLNFKEHGFKNFYLAINYKGEMLRDYFGDGSRWDIQIRYLEESKPLGTAGALGLLPEAPKQPVIVMNGDLLTKVNFKHLLDFHRKQGAAATMCIREYAVSVPYGVLNLEGSQIQNIDEKPVHKFFVNAGIYVLEPDLVKYLPVNEEVDMPHLFESLIRANRPTAAFPICEYWLDIGRKDDFARANGDFPKVFET